MFPVIEIIETIIDEQLVYWDAAGGLSLNAPITNTTASLVPPSITVISFICNKSGLIK